MSIVESILAATTQPGSAEKLAAGDWAFLAVGLLAVAVAGLLGVYRPRNVVGPRRIPPGRQAWPLALVLGAAIICWFGGSVIYMSIKQVVLMQHEGPAARITESDLTAGDYAVLSTMPPMLAFGCLLGGDFVVSSAMVGWLGIAVRRLPGGLMRGLGAALIALPFLYLVLAVMQQVYQRIGYEHPKEHDLLRVMGQSSSRLSEWALIVGAVVVAPLFEEYLFRGHLQTLLRQGLIRITTPRPLEPLPVMVAWPPPPAAPAGASAVPAPAPQDEWVVAPPAAPVAMPPIAYSSPVVESSAMVEDSSAEPQRPPVWQVWTAILLTSLAFASVHPVWMFPAIFTLSLMLGYLYERTGNLWASIGLHATFNATSTVFYLLSQSHGH